MYRIAIVEDEPVYASSLREYIERYAQEMGSPVEITIFQDGLDLVDNYEARWDVICLDIQLKHMDGISAARRIRELDDKTVLIFITSLAQYALQGFQVQAMDYLLKPVNYQKVCTSLSRVWKLLKRDEEKYVILPWGENKRKVSVSDIFYCEVTNHDLSFVTRQGTCQMRGSLKKAETILEGCHFSRCNHCYLVNLANVTEVGRDSVIVGPHELQVSRMKRKQFLQEYSDYLGVEL